MEITEVETYVVDADWRNWFFVQVRTDEGITGSSAGIRASRKTATASSTPRGRRTAKPTVKQGDRP